MGVQTQLAMVGALVVASLLLLRWAPSDDAGAGRTALLASVRGSPALVKAPCAVPSPKPPVSIEWTGRETMTVTYEGTVDVEVYKHDFPGSTLWLDFWDRVNRQQWEPETLWVLRWFLGSDPKSVYVDFGSWIGPTILFAGQFAGKIYSLEPDPLSFSTLNANINLNPAIERKTHVYHECISDKAGLIEMAGSGESNTRMTDVLDTKFLKAGSRWKVPCRTLPQFIAEEKVDISRLKLIKMDTEGTELWLLPSLRPWLEGLGKGKKPAIWLSVHNPFWKDAEGPAHAAKVQAAWDVLALFDYVYDADLKRIHPTQMKPDFCPDFCTFLLSDVEYTGMSNEKKKLAAGTA